VVPHQDNYSVHDLIHKFDRMRSIMSVVSSELDTLTDIEHSILCIDPIETPQFKYSLSFTMSSHQMFILKKSS